MTESNAERQRRYRARNGAETGVPGRKPATDNVCGSDAGAARHRRRSEAPCDACQVAHAAARKARRNP